MHILKFSIHKAEDVQLPLLQLSFALQFFGWNVGLWMNSCALKILNVMYWRIFFSSSSNEHIIWVYMSFLKSMARLDLKGLFKKKLRYSWLSYMWDVERHIKIKLHENKMRSSMHEFTCFIELFMKKIVREGLAMSIVKYLLWNIICW